MDTLEYAIFRSHHKLHMCHSIMYSRSHHKLHICHSIIYSIKPSLYRAYPNVLFRAYLKTLISLSTAELRKVSRPWWASALIGQYLWLWWHFLSTPNILASIGRYCALMVKTTHMPLQFLDRCCSFFFPFYCHFSHWKQMMIHISWCLYSI